MKKYPRSLSEIKLLDIKIKNRILSSPRNINSADLEGNVSDKTIRNCYYWWYSCKSPRTKYNK